MLIPFSHGGLWGYLAAETGAIAIQPRYEWARCFSEERAAVKLDQKLGFIDPGGALAIPNRYDGKFIFQGHDFKDGLVPVSRGGRQGFCDPGGAEVIPCRYEQVHRFAEELAVVCESKKWGAIDRSGATRVPLRYDGFKSRFSAGLAGAKKDFKISRRLGDVESATWKWGFIDVTGRERIPLDYRAVRSFSEGLAAVCNWEPGRYPGARLGLYGYVDTRGDLRIRHRFDYAYPFEDGIAMIKDMAGGDEKLGFIDTRGQPKIPCVYDDAKRVGEGRLALLKDGLYGLYDLAGRELVAPRFTRVGRFGSGLLPVAEGGEQQGVELKGARWSYVDKDGKEAFATGFDACGSFVEGLATVTYQGRQSLVKPTGAMALSYWCEAIHLPK